MKTKKLLNAVEEGTLTAAEYLTPYVEQALREGGQIADQAYSRMRPVIKDARIRTARLASDTFEKVHPVLDDALDRVYPAVDATVKVVKPAVDDALQSIPPTVDSAREKVQADYLPRLAEALHALAAEPLAKELKVAVASAALAKELDRVSAPKKSSGWKTFGKILLAGAALGGVVVAIKKLLADPSTGWETHTPKTAYIADPVADVVNDVAAKATAAAAEAKATVAEAADEVADKAAEVTGEVKKKAAKAKDDIEAKLAELADQADQAEGDDVSPLADSPYGEGSYVGSEPPEGFNIKGNDRSMKYHVPGSAAYERTIAEVWFNSEAAAQAAGFVGSQR